MSMQESIMFWKSCSIVESNLNAEERKPKVAVVGAGWGGWGAAKALCEMGCEVLLLDGMEDPTGSKPLLTPTGKPFEGEPCTMSCLL